MSSPVTKQIAEMIDMLPMQEQRLAFELIKRLVMAWDSDFTKLTPFERDRLVRADSEIKDGQIVDHSEINWD